MPSAKADELNNALIAISQSMADRSQLASTMNAILAAARQLTQATHGIIYVLNQTGDQLVPLAVHQNNAPQSNHPWSALAYEDLAENDPFSFALQSGEVVLINELYKYNGYDCEQIYETERAIGIKSNNLVAWPLRDQQGITVGLLVLFDLYIIDDEQSLSVFTQLASTSIRQAILLETFGHDLRQLESDNRALSAENRQLKARQHVNYDGPIAHSSAMNTVMDRLQRILRLPVDVLLRGETGSGKEVIAKYIHTNSDRATQPFIAQNCAAIPEQLLESELFGHKKGAFTGADKDKIGLFEAANGGTLFLDEIGDMPLLLQAKLLRVLQERKVRRIGATKEIDIDVRVIAATHCNIMAQIKKGDFRADLFYRLNVFPVTLPPLRERQDDIIPLAELFIREAATKLHLKMAPTITRHAKELLCRHHFPGNVRELRNIIERSILLSDLEKIDNIEFGEEADTSDLTSTSNLPLGHELNTFATDNQYHNINGLQDVTTPNQNRSLKEAVSQYERDLLSNYLCKFNWQTSRVAKELEVPVSTLHHKIKKHNINQNA
ncbi:sigma 54-interacting transcriptional regulator [Thaumasiovibrio sp. DFM-14]|uniref:sigma 54-interacting transcriptional regulator n=1 Tax=Thaumasiovibrio sp. DFM-14 TaxID=3384792 RepID=UPI00399F3F1D